MADLKTADSGYQTGAIDTHTDIVNDPGGDAADADHINHVASACVAIQTVLGTGTTLKGTQADLVARLAIALETNGKLKDFSATTKTNFPGGMAEGLTGATSYTASQLLRVNSGNTAFESSGQTLPAGTIVGTTDAQTLTNKTLTTPTIGDFTNSTHDHANAAGGNPIGTSGLTSATVTRSKLNTTTVSLAGSLGTGATEFTLNAYAFFPMIHVSSAGQAAGDMTGHATDGASADAPRFAIHGGSGGTYDVDYRYVQA